MGKNKIKESVQLSAYSTFITIVAIIVFAGVAYSQFRRQADIPAFIFCSLLVIACCLALFYMPMSVSVNDNQLRINRSLWFKSIPLDEISSIKLFQPTMAERRLCASGGWFGYWGWFSNNEIGKYFGYYGKASDCFLVTLKNGKKYLLGCKNPAIIVDFIQSKLK